LPKRDLPAADVGQSPAFHPGTNPVRRLTNRQYANTVRWVFGIGADFEPSLGTDRALDGYSNGARQAIPSVSLGQTYGAVAARVAAEATDRKSRARIFDVSTCRDREHCLETFMRLFGRRLFRRPLEPSELATLVKGASEKASVNDDFWEGARFGLEVMLQSVPFLYVVEHGEKSGAQSGHVRRTPHELAARLALVLWNGGPDDRLLDLADQGGLRTRIEIETEVARMLRDPRAKDAALHFFREWLGYDLALGQKKEWDVYKEFRGPLIRSMIAESDGVVTDMLTQDRPVMDIFGVDSTAGDEAVRNFYQVSQREGSRVKLPPERRGILSLGAYIMANSGSHMQSPTQRGLAVLRRLLCEDVGSPPPSAPTELPEVTDQSPRTIRERTELFMLGNERCSRCHEDMDPIGFLFERFNVIGKFRDSEKVKDSPGGKKPVNDQGAITPLGLEKVDGLSGLAAVLATNEASYQCMLRNVLEWSLGRANEPGDARVLAAMDHAYKTKGRTFPAVMQAIVTSDTLLYMRPQ
jgi:hypothetical protein